MERREETRQQSPWWSVSDVAEYLDVHEQTVRRWLRRGDLRGVSLGRKAGWRIAPEDVDAFLDARRSGAGILDQSLELRRIVRQQVEAALDEEAAPTSDDPAADFVRMLATRALQDPAFRDRIVDAALNDAFRRVMREEGWVPRDDQEEQWLPPTARQGGQS